MGEIVTCDACAEEIEVPPYKLEKNEHHFCDRECYHNWKSDEWVPPWQEDDKPVVECKYCGDEFEIYPYQEGKRKFCSRECADEFKTTLHGAETGNWKGGKVTSFCQQCGQPFQYWDRDCEPNPKYCSKECYGIVQEETQKGENNPVWRGGWEHYYGANWEQQAEKARARDDHTCQRCGIDGEELDRALDVHHKKRLGWFREEYDAPEWWEKGNQLDNLVSMCSSCHKIVEWEENA